MAEAVAGLGTMLLHPRPMNRVTMTLWVGTTPMAVGPIFPAAAVIHPIPMIQNSAQSPNILHQPHAFPVQESGFVASRGGMEERSMAKAPPPS